MTASFKYDGVGRRSEKTISGVTTGYLYDGMNLVQEKASSASGAAVTANLVTGLNVDEQLLRLTAGQGTSIGTDALGSSVLETTVGGAVTAYYQYDPYGATTKVGTSTNTQQYTGRENDGTGLFYYRARYYHPVLGRFISEDPIGWGSGQTNPYAYVGGNPLSFIDPDGLAKKSATTVCIVPGCGARHGGVRGPYCPSCYDKSLDPNGGIPPYVPIPILPGPLPDKDSSVGDHSKGKQCS